MAEIKRIMISLPDSLLTEMDGFVREKGKSRSEFIREAVKRYMEEHRRMELRERMKEGYRKMAAINLALAEGALAVDEELFASYESCLQESERPE